MKYRLACFLFLIIPMSVAHSLEPDWILVRKQDSVKVWLYSKDRAVTGSILISKNADGNISLSGEQKKYFQQLERQKKTALSYLGIIDWTVSDYTWKQKEKFYELTLFGTYKDALGNVIQFHEIHEFRKKMTRQILFTRPVDGKVSDDVAEQFVKQVRRDLETP